MVPRMGLGGGKGVREWCWEVLNWKQKELRVGNAGGVPLRRHHVRTDPGLGGTGKTQVQSTPWGSRACQGALCAAAPGPGPGGVPISFGTGIFFFH